MRNRLNQLPAEQKRCALDDRRAHFEHLLTECRDKILLYVFSLVHDENDAEDICQRASVVLWKKFPEYDFNRSFLAWACGVARFEAMNHRRASAADRLLFRSDVMDLLAASLETVDSDARQQRLGALRRCLQSLPERDQQLLQKLYWQGNSGETLATELGCTLRTFYNRMYLIRRRLMQCVARRLRAEPTEQGSDHSVE